MREEFASSTTMAMVCQKAAELCDIGEEFTLVCPPNVSVTLEMMTKSLCECSFCPAVSFTVKPRSTDGVISSPPPANVEFEDAFVAEVLLFLKSDGLLAWEVSNATKTRRRPPQAKPKPQILDLDSKDHIPVAPKSPTAITPHSKSSNLPTHKPSKP
jgi:hypothetical protein